MRLVRIKWFEWILVYLFIQKNSHIFFWIIRKDSFSFEYIITLFIVENNCQRYLKLLIYIQFIWLKVSEFRMCMHSCNVFSNVFKNPDYSLLNGYVIHRFVVCLHHKQLLILCIALGYSLFRCDPLQWIGLGFLLWMLKFNTYVQWFIIHYEN